MIILNSCTTRAGVWYAVLIRFRVLLDTVVGKPAKRCRQRSPRPSDSCRRSYTVRVVNRFCQTKTPSLSRPPFHNR